MTDYATLTRSGYVERTLTPREAKQWRAGIRASCRADKLRVRTWEGAGAAGTRKVCAWLVDRTITDDEMREVAEKLDGMYGGLL